MEAIKFIYGTQFENFGELDQVVYEKSFKNWNWVLKTLEDDWQDEDTIRTLILIQGGKS